MDKDQLHDLRRTRLREWIDIKHETNVNQFSLAAGLKQPVIADVLSGRKSFGDKFAMRVEKLVRGMPTGYLLYPVLTLRDHHVIEAYRTANPSDRAAAERVLGLYQLPDTPAEEVPARKKSSALKGLRGKAPPRESVSRKRAPFGS